MYGELLLEATAEVEGEDMLEVALSVLMVTRRWWCESQGRRLRACDLSIWGVEKMRDVTLRVVV